MQMSLTHLNIIYINLKHRTERRHFIEAQLDKMGLLENAIYLEAIDGETLSEKEFRPIRETFRTLAKREERIIGRIGCLMSHLKALEIAIANKFENVLIIEDDCQFIEGAEQRKFTVPTDADVFYLGGLFWRQQPEETLQTGEWVKIDRRHLKLACCLNYGIIGKSKIQEIYNILTSVRPSAIDILYINHIQKRGHCYVLNPVLCYQNHTLGSDVTTKGGPVQSFVKKKDAYHYS